MRIHFPFCIARCAIRVLMDPIIAILWRGCRRGRKKKKKYETIRLANFKTSTAHFSLFNPGENCRGSHTYAPPTAQILNGVWELLPVHTLRRLSNFCRHYSLLLPFFFFFLRSTKKFSGRRERERSRASRGEILDDEIDTRIDIVEIKVIHNQVKICGHVSLLISSFLPQRNLFLI